MASTAGKSLVHEQGPKPDGQIAYLAPALMLLQVLQEVPQLDRSTGMTPAACSDRGGRRDNAR
jgi:hypothetical protein